jgi:hypothetical protein
MLEALETLGLVAGTDDQLSGPIPAELGQLSSLVGLYLENIRLSRQERAIFAQQMTDRSGCETQACCKPENRPAISKKYAKVDVHVWHSQSSHDKLEFAQHGLISAATTTPTLTATIQTRDTATAADCR